MNFIQRSAVAAISIAAIISGGKSIIGQPMASAATPQVSVSPEQMYTELAAKACEYLLDGVEPKRAGIRAGQDFPQYGQAIKEAATSNFAQYKEDITLAIVNECGEEYLAMQANS